MLEVIGFIVQSAGAATENGPSASRPSGSLSSVLGTVCSGTLPPCGLAATPACVLSVGLAAVGLTGGAVPGLLGAAPDCQSVAGGSSALGGSFLHELANTRAISRARRVMRSL